MTLRPFKISNGNSYIVRIQTHRGEDLIKKSIKIPKKFWKKLLSYPITAFGYRIDYEPNNKELPNPKFDKKDIIKALDFWIEYFVYQNKCDYILENTVNKDFELHLEELIRVREAVLKDPADTKYVRQKIRPKFHIQDVKKKQKMMVEFTENVLETRNSPFSTVDQFCYKVKTMTRKEYENYNGRYVPTVSTSSGLIADMIRVQSNLNFEENFRDEGDRWGFGGIGLGSIIRPDEHSMMWVRERHPLNPDNWAIVPNMIGIIQEGFKIVNIINGLNIATDFRTAADARSYIEGIRNRG